MKGIYKEYFQKSKVFLYPLLNIKKGVRYVPAETYIMEPDTIADPITIKDYKLICLYEIDPKDKFYSIFEQEIIFKNRYFDGFYPGTSKNHETILRVYTFDMSRYKYDMEMFVEGKYSKFSNKAKIIIQSFFGEIGTIAEYIESYLHPKHWQEEYAQFLNVNTELLEKTYELCDKPDLKKETIKEKCTNSDFFKNKSLHLHK